MPDPTDHDLTDIPDFLRRQKGDVRPPPAPTVRNEARALRQAKERGLAQRRAQRRHQRLTRDRAMREYRRLYGPSAPDPGAPAASVEQRLVFGEILARVRMAK